MTAVSLKTVTVNAFNNIWLPASGGGVTVVNGSNSVQGIQDTTIAIEIGMTMRETPGGVVTVVYDDIGTLEADGALTIDGKRVWVADINPSAVKGLVRITYTDSQPIPESML